MSQILLCLTQKTVKKIPQKTVSAFKPIITVDKFRARCQRGSMMGRMTLITGGARSGKSAFAESLLAGKTDVVYLATAAVADADMAERVRQHQLRRPAAWRTFEGSKHLHRAVGDAKHYLLDCLSLLTSNVMFEMTKDAAAISVDAQRQVEEAVLEEISALRDRIAAIDGALILVTNEVGLAIVPEHPIARAYRDILGRVNQRAAALSDDVYLVVCGVPLQIKPQMSRISTEIL